MDRILVSVINIVVVLPSEVPEHIKIKFGELLDKYRMLFSYYADNCRPVCCDGKPVVVDIDLTTDVPIFMPR